MFNRINRSVLGLVAVCGLALVSVATSSSQAAGVDLPSWHVGSGQPTGNFIGLTNNSFGGGTLELYQRSIFRQSALDVPLTGNTYTVPTGPQIAGQNGAPVSNAARFNANFDYHIYYSGGVQNLDSLTMTITSPAGNTVSAPFFDMKVANNDNVTGSTPFPGGDSQDPFFYIQDSQNYVFAPWFVPTFDMNVQGTYSFTLTAVEGVDTASMTMFVNVVPAPASLALLGLGGLAAARRRR